MKKTILHFIYDLGRGGAETMLVKVLKELPEYENIVVTLYGNNQFGKELVCDKFICLKQRSLFFFPLTAFTLRRLIKKQFYIPVLPNYNAVTMNGICFQAQQKLHCMNQEMSIWICLGSINSTIIYFWFWVPITSFMI